MYFAFSDNVLDNSAYISSAVHTGDKSLQEGLGDVWTCRMTLASAYVLCRLSATWSQLQKIRPDPRPKELVAATRRCYELKSLELDKRTTLVLSNTRKLNRDPFTN